MKIIKKLETRLGSLGLKLSQFSSGKLTKNEIDYSYSAFQRLFVFVKLSAIINTYTRTHMYVRIYMNDEYKLLEWPVYLCNLKRCYAMA